jgi:hypothetical protein
MKKKGRNGIGEAKRNWEWGVDTNEGEGADFELISNWLMHCIAVL